MSFQSILPRKIAYESCRLVYKQLEQLIKQHNQKPPLHPDVEAELKAVLEAGRVLDSLSADATSIREVDRGADSFIAAYFRALEEQEHCYNHPHLVALTEPEKTRLETIQRLRLQFFPEKTDFLTKGTSLQWSRLQDIKGMILDTQGKMRPAMQADLELIGFLSLTERLLRWIQKYGEAMGSDAVVEQRTKKVFEATSDFLEAWENLVIEIRSTLRKTSDTTLKEAYISFLALYDEQVQRELETEQRYRKTAEKKKAAAEAKSADEPEDSEPSKP
jgi:hypothetical protein